MSTTFLTKPHFFKPLIPGFEDEFLIPVSFFKYLKGQECHKLTLRSQGGKLWPIKINGRQFEDGWKQFIQDHDLHIGDFLVFRHEGNLVFDVLAFDRTTCEREYPPFIKEEEIDIQPQNIPIYTSSGKKLDKKKKVKTRLEAKAGYSVPEHPYCVIKLTPDSINRNRLHVPRKFARENGLYGRSCSVILKDEDANCWQAKLWYTSLDKKFIIGSGWGVFHSVHKFKAGDTMMVELIKNGQTPVLRMHRLQEHVDVAREPKYENDAQAGSSSPGHLHANTEASKLRKSQLKVPEVAEESGPGLQEHLEFKWEPTYQNNAHVGSSSLGHLHANTKASELSESQLKIPEVAKESGSRKSKRYKQPETASEAKASSFSIVQKSFFVAKVTSSTSRKSHLYIPTKFSRLHLQNKKYSKVILRDQEGRSWPAKLWHKSSDEEVHIADGWKEFSDANKIKPGDSFVFEFIETGIRPVFKMCRFKANYKAGKNQEDASSLVEKPHFYVNMQVSHYKTCQMKIPRNFAKRHGLATGKCLAMTIKNEMGSSWLVSLRLDKNNEVFMTYGWFEFVKDNSVEKGDVFMLELVKGGTIPEMKYYALKQETDDNQKGIWEDSEEIKPIV